MRQPAQAQVAARRHARAQAVFGGYWQNQGLCASPEALANQEHLDTEKMGATACFLVAFTKGVRV